MRSERARPALDVVKKTEPRQSAKVGQEGPKRALPVSNTSGAAKKRSRKRRIAARDGLRCNYCFAQFKNLSEATVDHFIPRSKGGTNQMSNLVLACDDCNQNKKNIIFIR